MPLEFSYTEGKLILHLFRAFVSGELRKILKPNLEKKKYAIDSNSGEKKSSII